MKWSRWTTLWLVIAIVLCWASFSEAGVVYEATWEHDGQNVHGFYIVSWLPDNPGDKYYMVVDSATARVWKFLHPRARAGENWVFALLAFNYRGDTITPTTPTNLKVAQIFVVKEGAI